MQTKQNIFAIQSVFILTLSAHVAAIKRILMPKGHILAISHCLLPNHIPPNDRVDDRVHSLARPPT